MAQHLGNLTLLVRDYDEAIRYYVDVLGFELLEDTDRGEGKRWVRVAPASAGAPALLLAQAATDEQRAHIGNQAGGRVFLFLNTDDFQGDYARYQAAGVQFLEAPRHEDYGSVVVFADLYGNKWDLLQLK
ncbi:VOC family protein [Hymenobacter edaphi]|uniref:VOC family protein n=1 Tax=Hymenobacter edaphi TaxID=2211146 RepID=A0A328BI48_9BACT|nr:VOC family protein [Hymenobacter edaphi]RAK67162.1 VOC family protein [Hymenobacter edaphi]